VDVHPLRQCRQAIARTAYRLAIPLSRDSRRQAAHAFRTTPKFPNLSGPPKTITDRADSRAGPSPVAAS